MLTITRRSWLLFLSLMVALACALPSAALWAEAGGNPAPSESGASATTPGPTLLYPDMTPPTLKVQSAVLMEFKSGRVLYAYNEDRAEPPASLTKMMTADLTLQAVEQKKLSLDEQVKVSKEAYALARKPGVSKMFLQPNLPVTVDQLLYGLMVMSGNDAAVALAQAVSGGSEAAFVNKMNARAQSLGLSHTHFADAAGLADGGRTTALDMAKLARDTILNHPEILKYSATKSYRYNPSVTAATPNYNTLLFKDDRIDGLKTGNIGGLYHLVATGKQGNMRLIAVVMGTASDQDRAAQAGALIDWGFASFRTDERSVRVQLPVYKGAKNTVAATAHVYLVLPKQGVTFQQSGQVEQGGRSQSLDAHPYLVAPIKQGQQIGHVVERSNGGRTVSFALTADAAVPRGGFFGVFWDSIRLIVRNLFHFSH